MKTNVIAGYFGRKGSGKSHLIKAHIRARLHRALIWDPNGEYRAEVGGRQWQSVRDFLGELARQGDYGLESFTDCPRSELVRMLRAGFELEGGAVVFEEVSTHIEHPCVSEALQQLLDRGRHRRVDLLFATPRPMRIPRSMTQQADYLYLFATQEPRDLKFFEEVAGREAAETLRRLKPFEAYCVQP